MTAAFDPTPITPSLSLAYAPPAQALMGCDVMASEHASETCQIRRSPSRSPSSSESLVLFITLLLALLLLRLEGSSDAGNA